MRIKKDKNVTGAVIVGWAVELANLMAELVDGRDEVEDDPTPENYRRFVKELDASDAKVAELKEKIATCSEKTKFTPEQLRTIGLIEARVRACLR